MLSCLFSIFIPGENLKSFHGFLSVALSAGDVGRPEIGSLLRTHALTCHALVAAATLRRRPWLGDGEDFLVSGEASASGRGPPCRRGPAKREAGDPREGVLAACEAAGPSPLGPFVGGTNGRARSGQTGKSEVLPCSLTSRSQGAGRGPRAFSLASPGSETGVSFSRSGSRVQPPRSPVGRGDTLVVPTPLRLCWPVPPENGGMSGTPRKTLELCCSATPHFSMGPALRTLTV